MPKSDEPTERRVRTLSERNAPKGHGTFFYVLVFFTALLVLNAVFGESGLLAMMRARQQYNEMAADVARAHEENERLSQYADKIRDDDKTIEEIARTELGLVRPGEKVFIIKDLPPAGQKK